MSTSQRPLDATDLRLLSALRLSPRASHTELARTVGIARGTLYSRLDRLETEGVIVGFGPDVDPVKAGFDVLAFTTLEIQQGSYDETVAALGKVLEILEIHTVTGTGDLLCRIVARSNDHLHVVLQEITAVPSVLRTQSQLALATSVRRSLIEVLNSSS